MTAKEFLNQYRDAERKARMFRREYEKELELIDTVRSTADIDGLPRGNGINKRVEDRAVRLADKAAEWKIAELDALHMRQIVFDMISDIPDTAGEVLYLRYIDCLTWKNVCASIPMTWPSVRKHHDKGLAIVSKKIQEVTYEPVVL